MNDSHEFFQTCLLAAARNKAGSWNKLSKELPCSISQLYYLRKYKQQMGGEIFIRVMSYLNSWEEINKFAQKTFKKTKEEANAESNQNHKQGREKSTRLENWLSI